MKNKLFIISLTALCCSSSVFAQSGKNQPARANPQVIEVGNNNTSGRSSAQGKELPANSAFKFDYRFFVIIEQDNEMFSGHFDLDTRTGTIRSTRDDMPRGSYILRTPANKIYTYAEADGKKIVMEMNKGDNAFDAWFNNEANSNSINFNAGKPSSLVLRKTTSGAYSIKEQTIETDAGFGVLYTTPFDIPVHTGGSFDPMSGLGVIYDAKSKAHYLIAKIETTEMTANISAIRKMNTVLEGSNYTKMSGMMNFSEGNNASSISKDANVYKESNNMADLANIGQIYAGGDIQLQIDEANNHIKELDEYLSKPLTAEKKSELMEEKRNTENTKVILTRHLSEIQKKTPDYWQKNINAFYELKAKQAQEFLKP